MKISIKNIFWDSQSDIDDWLLWFADNLNPFPVSMNFLLDLESILSVLATRDMPTNPVSIFCVFVDAEMQGSFIITTDFEDESAEFTHLVLDRKIHRTFLSGLILLEIGKYVDNYLKTQGIVYSHTNIPVDSTSLRKLLHNFGAEQKSILKFYQKVKIGDSYSRRDAIYFEKLYNIKK